MTPLSIQVPFPVFQDRDGQPLDNGYVWIGETNLNPQTNPVVAYFDAALTIPAAQPLRTINGYVSRAGTPAQIYVDGVNFSILVQDSKGSMVYNFPDGTGISPDACGVTYNPPFTGAVQTPVCEKLAETVSVKDFGAVGDGVTDDTQALRDWINADAGIHLLGGTDKIYLVNAPTTGAIILPIANGKRRNIVGNGATIKIANNSRQYTAIIGSNSFADDLSDLTVDGVVFDQNSGNNTFPVSGGVLVYAHMTVCVRNGSNINIRNNIIKNIVCTNSLFLNGNAGAGLITVKHAFINNNKWYNIGGSANAQDHSTIYMHADDFTIEANYGEGTSLGATGTQAFIETHASHHNVFNNVAKNFIGFANITGVYAGPDTEKSFVQGNHGIALLTHGIRMFSATLGTHTTGYGIIGLTVSNNRMRIHQTQMTAGTSKFYIGYGFQSGASLPVKDVQIINNVVEYDEETTIPSYNSISCAVGANESAFNTIYERLYIGGNVIINSPANAIGLGGGNGTFKDCRIGQNTIINPGQSLAPAVGPQYKAAIIGFCNRYTGSLVVEKQNITDTFPVTRIVYGAYFLPTVSSIDIPCTVEVDVTLNGDKAAYQTPVKNGSSRLSILSMATQNKALSPTGETYRAGSTVVSTDIDITYQIRTTGSIWTNHGYGSAPPASGTNQIGSTRINTAPTSGGNYGWVCTIAGTPGTWRAFGVIS
jgi:hypothetical protein